VQHIAWGLTVQFRILFGIVLCADLMCTSFVPLDCKLTESSAHVTIILFLASC
jgi:hypothetical protein